MNLLLGEGSHVPDNPQGSSDVQLQCCLALLRPDPCDGLQVGFELELAEPGTVEGVEVGQGDVLTDPAGTGKLLQYLQDSTETNKLM